MNTQIFEPPSSNKSNRNQSKVMDSPSPQPKDIEIFEKPVLEVTRKVLKTRKSSKVLPDESSPKILSQQQPLMLNVSPIDISVTNADSSDSPAGDGQPAILGGNGFSKRFVPAQCPSEHDGYQRMSAILPVNIDTLMRTLYTKSKFMTKFREHRKLKNVVLGEWELNDDKSKTRTVKYTLPMRLGPKYSHVNEVQVMKNCCELGRLYSIDIVTWNEGIPYADTFYISTHHCLVRTAEDQTIFTAFSQVKFKKPQWGFIKTLIEKNANEGMDNYYADLLKHLQMEFCTTQTTKAKRHRRALSRSTIQSNELADNNNNNHHKVNMDSVTSSNPRGSHGRLLTWFILVLMVIVLTMNSVLLFKLWSYEGDQLPSSRLSRTIDFQSLNLTSRSPHDWVKLLQHQEELHADEISRLHAVLEVAIQMLKNTEKTLIDLLYYLVSQEQENGGKITFKTKNGVPL